MTMPARPNLLSRAERLPVNRAFARHVSTLTGAVVVLADAYAVSSREWAGFVVRVGDVGAYTSDGLMVRPLARYAGGVEVEDAGRVAA